LTNSGFSQFVHYLDLDVCVSEGRESINKLQEPTFFHDMFETFRLNVNSKRDRPLALIIHLFISLNDM